ncbi:class I SAM-dependent methyltransferase [Stieleria varia]|uniref:Ubiquinone/menaquinone biosynthesis methyltransferase n=1 Tax=Stieleria varia TaxID=2528005 RepID=A0A5C6B2F1_9BACT|nr:class I SAM-dependent methyltransferase [Stieleria varia]TWU06100.1 ubiquinone/menaquinone biosynthesis methyltransferase [Stieleria varia]
MSPLNRMKTICRLIANRDRGDNHAERLENFYARQAESYDDTRSRMLHGRQGLIDLIPVVKNSVWIELGAGTGSNLELLGDRIDEIQHLHLVDLSPSMIQIAQKRIKSRNWRNVTTHLEDATKFSPPTSADVILFSYSLTMIPNWFAAIDNARRILRPGGVIAVVDYYVSRYRPDNGWVRHDWACRTFAPNAFAKNGVHPNPDHIYYLHEYFQPSYFAEHVSKLLGPFFSAPYYQFIGNKSG